MALIGCEHLREVAPDVALGLLTGEKRAAALAHLERCEACRAEVASLAGTADEVLLAAPEVSPPPGFAARVLAQRAAGSAGGDRLPAAPAPGSRPARRLGHRRRYRRAAVVALAAAALLAAGLAVVINSDDRSAPEVVATAEMRTGQGLDVGHATLSGDVPVSVTLELPEWDALVERWGGASDDSYWLAVEMRDGARTMQPAPGDTDRDGWSMTVDVPADEVATVSVLDSEGRVWCTGRFNA